MFFFVAKIKIQGKKIKKIKKIQMPFYYKTKYIDNIHTLSENI